MKSIQQLITDHIDIWTAAEAEKKSGRGRSSGNSENVYGVKRLRELILELAVRGKLVPQDPNDEQASELLKRIQVEKSKLISNGTIKRDKPNQPINKTELPFQLPTNWEWCRVGDIGHDWGQKIPDSDFTYIEVSAIDSLHGVISSPALVKPENAPSRARKLVKQGTIIYSTVRPYLSNIAVIEKEFLPEPIASTAFAVIHPFCSMPPKYFLYFFRSPVFVRYVEAVQMGIAYPAINDGQFFSGLIPLPPIEEQYRIVAKVNELMALCDQLEAHHNNATEAHEKLISHLLSTLTESQNADEFSENWQRIAAHFDILFTTESSIDALKQSLLQLAVMGKLVPQDPNDEPARELLKRIQVEKAKLIFKKKSKNDKSLPPIEENEELFDLPLGWKWVRKADVFFFLNGYAFKSEWFKPTGIRLLRNVNVSHGITDWHEAAHISVEHATEFEDFKLDVGDVVLSLDRPIISTGLKYAVISNTDIPCLLLQRVAKICPIGKCVSSRYLSIWLNSPFFIGSIDPGRSNGVPHISTVQVSKMAFALPPVAEQDRIVVKVGKLITLCEKIKSNILEKDHIQQKLADALIKQAAEHKPNLG